MVSTAERMSLIDESTTFTIFAEATRLKSEGLDVVDFSAGEPDFPTPDNIKLAAKRAILETKHPQVANEGLLELREAVCARHKADYETNYSVEECCISTGGKQSLFNLTQALLSPGDEVIIPLPYWVTYKDIVSYAGARCRFVQMDESSQWGLTAEVIEKAITARTRLIVINSPSNPCGAVITPIELRKIVDLAVRHEILVLTDECYCRFVYDRDPFSVASILKARDSVIVAGSVSKTYAMTGWRIGFTLAPRHIIKAAMAVQDLSTSYPTFFSQSAAIEALTSSQEPVSIMLAEFRKRRSFVLGKLRAIPRVTVQEPQGAFYAYPNISSLLPSTQGSSEMFARKLLKTFYVATVPGEAFGTTSHVRISYGTSMEKLAKGLDRISEFCRSLE